MRNKINFITGETYTLAEFFSGNRRIIIPDLQRDYCWGDKIHTNERKELVSGYLITLIQQYEKKNHEVEKLNLGLIYGYEIPANHIQLCDGQQRITTLFLLLGFLNKKSNKNVFQSYLMSDYELSDDKEPYLQYSIRETSLYFLSDLVCHFFLQDPSDKEQVDNVNDIESCSWFFNEYRTDPSISSMIKALKIIDNTLKNKDSNWCIQFGDYLINRLTFMYYDMENRKNGEETFVVINTTGEPLSQTQNLKPLVVTDGINKNYSSTNGIDKDWEEIETWFWKNRNNGNDTADAGFTEFLRWVSIIKLAEKADSDSIKQISEILSKSKYSFNYSEIPFCEIYAYWKVVERVFYSSFFDRMLLSPAEREISIESGQYKYKVKALTQIDCFRLLPVIAFCYKNNCDLTNRNALRLYHFVDNLSQIDNIQKNVNTLVDKVISIALTCYDIIELLETENLNKFSDSILTEEEKQKLRIIKTHEKNESMRTEIEEEFWRTQKHPIFRGEIKPLIEWTNRTGTFNITRFKNLKDQFELVFPHQVQDITDLTRRSLLTMNLREYPWRNSFGFTGEEWKAIILSNIDRIGLYLYRLYNSYYISPLSVQKAMINSYSNTTDSHYDFVRYSFLLEYCDQKRINYWGKEGKLCKSKWSRPFSIENAKLLYELKGDWKCNNIENAIQLEEKNQWKVWYNVQGHDCVIIQSQSLGAKIEVVSKQDSLHEIRVIMIDNHDTKDVLGGNEFGIFDLEDNVFSIIKEFTIKDCADYLQKLISFINEQIDR